MAPKRAIEIPKKVRILNQKYITMEKLLVKCGVEEYHLPYNDVLYLEADGPYTLIYTTDCKFMECKNIGFYETVLPSPPFVRVHNSYIINASKILIKTKTAITLEKNATIPVSRGKHENLKNMIKTLQGIRQNVTL
jgi:DNA-binding LytR/AlgR family response regulator